MTTWLDRNLPERHDPDAASTRLHALIEQAVHDWATVAEEIVRAAVPVFEGLREGLRDMTDQLVDAGVMQAPLPEEPRARALEAKRRRGHGPAPRPLDPRRRR